MDLAAFVSNSLSLGAEEARRPLGARIRSASIRLAVLIGIVLPIVSFILSIFLGAFLALVEGWPFQDCFFIILGELSGTGITLTDDDDTPESDVGRLFAAVISLVALGMFGVIVGILGGPLLDPLIEGVRLTVPAEDVTHRALKSIGKLAGLLFAGLPALAVVLSLIFGGMLCVTEGWSFHDSFYVILVELSATNIELVDMTEMYPENFFGKLVAAVISLWALAIFAAVLGVAGGPLCFAAMSVDPEHNLSVLQCMLRMTLFIVVGLPLIGLTVSAVFALFLSVLEGWEYLECLFLVLMNLSACEVRLTDDVLLPDSDFSKMAAAFSGMVGLAIFAACLVILGGVYMQPFSAIFGFKDGKSKDSPIVHAIKMLIFVILVFMPVLAMALSFVLGVFLSELEGWPIGDGFYVLLTEVSGTGIQLVDFNALPVESLHGRFMAAFCCLWTLAIFAGIVGVIAGDIVAPLMDMTDVESDSQRGTERGSNKGSDKGSDRVSSAEPGVLAEDKAGALPSTGQLVAPVNSMASDAIVHASAQLGDLMAEDGKAPLGASQERSPFLEGVPVVEEQAGTVAAADGANNSAAASDGAWVPAPASQELAEAAPEEGAAPPVAQAADQMPTEEPQVQDSPDFAAGRGEAAAEGMAHAAIKGADGRSESNPELGQEAAATSPKDASAPADSIVESAAGPRLGSPGAEKLVENFAALRSPSEPGLDDELVEMWFTLHTEAALTRVGTLPTMNPTEAAAES